MTTSSKWRAALVAAASFAVIAAGPLVGAQTAYAQYPPPPPSISVGATVVDPGDPLTFEASGFQPDQEVVALLLSKAVELGTFTADDQGQVSGTVTIPERTRPGWHTFKLRAEDPDLTLSAQVLVRDDGQDDDHDGDDDDHDGDDGDHDGDHGDHDGDHDGDHGDHDGHGGHGGNGGHDGNHGNHGNHGGNGNHGGYGDSGDRGDSGDHGNQGERGDHLANTGEDDNSLLLLGGAAGLLALGGGTVLTARRLKKNS